MCSPAVLRTRHAPPGLISKGASNVAILINHKITYVIEQLKDVATKEVELVGASSGSRTVAKIEVGAAGDAKEAET